MFCRVKTGEVDCYLKMVQWMVSWLRLLTMLLPGPDLHCAGPLALWRFSQHLPAKYT